MSVLGGREGIHTPDTALAFVCWPCKRGNCEPMVGVSRGCIGGRCTCDHQDVIPDVLVSLATLPSSPRRAYVPGKPANGVTRALRSEPAEKALRSRSAPGVRAAPESHRRMVVEQAVLTSPSCAAVAYDVSESTVRRWAVDLAVSFPPRRDREYPSKYTAAEKVNAVNLAHQLGSAKAASDVLGISATNIVKWARKMARPLAGKPGPPRKAPVPIPDPLTEALEVLAPEGQPLTKETAPCCLARYDEDGRPPIGYCSPECLRRPTK